MDKETEEVLTEQAKAVRLVSTDDWKWARKKLEDMLNYYLSIDSFPTYTDANQLQKEFEFRKKAVGLVRTWFEEVEGTATQREINNIINNEEELVTHFEKE